MLEQDNYFTAAELGLDELNPYIHANISEDPDHEGHVLAILTVQENLEFHRDLDRKYEEEYDARYFTEDDLLTADAEAALKKIVEERYKGEDFQLDDSGTEWFQFDLVLSVPADTAPEDLGTKFWEDTALVQFHNESDPGTFGSPYLFGSLMSEALGNR